MGLAIHRGNGVFSGGCLGFRLSPHYRWQFPFLRSILRTEKRKPAPIDYNWAVLFRCDARQHVFPSKRGSYPTEAPKRNPNGSVDLEVGQTVGTHCMSPTEND